MKREILFRGKLSHVNIWVEGNLIIANNGSQYIIPPNVFEQDGHHLIIDSDEPWRIDENTVCQFTGLTDKNGTKIFDGGIISVSGVVNKLVTYIDKYACFCLANTNEPNSKYMSPWQQVAPEWWNEFGREIELIGNIHDNPELLKP